MNCTGERYIYILLTRYPDTFSKLLRFFTRGQYNHASIGISESDGVFYSYVTTGFRKELPKQHPTFKKQEVPCRLYRLPVSEEVYALAHALLEGHAKRARGFKYNTLGLLFCLLRIVYKRDNHFFCSQFVSEVLETLGVVPLAKHSTLYLPDDFQQMKEFDLRFSGYLSKLVEPAMSKALLMA